jgi:hypothetical protein
VVSADSDARLAAYRRATSLAAAVAGVVLLFGTVVAVAPFATHPARLVDDGSVLVDRATSTTDATTLRSAVAGAPLAAAQRVRTVVATERPRAWQEAVTASGGGVVVRLGLALAAALLAGGVTQRILIGHYALKVGPVELEAVPVPAVAGAIRDVLS